MDEQPIGGPIPVSRVEYRDGRVYVEVELPPDHPAVAELRRGLLAGVSLPGQP